MKFDYFDVYYLKFWFNFKPGGLKKYHTNIFRLNNVI